MNQFQPGIKFKTVEDFLDYLPEEELMVVEALRELIFDCLPGVEERLNYNAPFYFGHKRMFFIWPASLPWGKVDQGVRLGFSHADLPDQTFAAGVLPDLALARGLLFEAAHLDGFQG
ncbi:DUF1801 domain-containing protein [Cryomorphaceae bacterium]|nr:DUF1801 domain-containing protein [Cryomorphaceae bacterium]